MQHWMGKRHWRRILDSRKGSTPLAAPNLGLKVFMDAHQPVTLKEGDRYPLGPPRTFCFVRRYSDPEDEKWGDSQGWYYSYRSSVSNTIAVLVGKRVEGVSVDSKGSIHYNYRRRMQSIFNT